MINTVILGFTAIASLTSIIMSIYLVRKYRQSRRLSDSQDYLSGKPYNSNDLTAKITNYKNNIKQIEDTVKHIDSRFAMIEQRDGVIIVVNPA